MHTLRRALLLALVFTLIASSFLALDTDAKRKRGSRHRADRSQIVQLVPKNQRPLSQYPELDQPINVPEPRGCYGLCAATVINRWSIRHEKATKCKPATVSGNRS